MPSIVDVARLAGVSPATASRALNHSAHPVSAPTRERVLRAAAQLDYFPSALARALVLGRTQTVAAIVHDITDPYFAEIARGAEDVGNQHGYLLIVCNSDRNPEKELNYVRLLRDYRVDGVIFVGGGMEDPAYVRRLQAYVVQMRRRGTAITLVATHRISEPCVKVDNLGAAQDMTSYLLALGHRRIAFVAGPPGLITSAERLRGYRLALEESNVPFDPDLVCPGDFTRESGHRAVENLMRQPELPTAIFAANDEAAIGCLNALKRRGVRVPDQVTVVGMDDISIAQDVDPPLTTVRFPLRELGARAMETVLRLRQKEPVDPVQWLGTELVVRASSGPPRIGVMLEQRLSR